MAGEAPRWWNKDTVAVVTGSNKGIGYEIVKGLAKNGVTTVLTSRNPERGQDALKTLKAEGFDSVIFHPLDVTSEASINDLATWLKNEFGGVDILINNAGILIYEKSSGKYKEIVEVKVTYEDAKLTLDTNYYGNKNVTKKLLPLLRPGARIVNLSSILGQLRYLQSESLIQTLGDEQHLTEEFVESYAIKYLEDVKAGRWKEEGWSTFYPQYTESKVFLNAYARAFAKTLDKRPKGEKIYVNNVHPGHIGTDMNDTGGPGSLEEGADTSVWLALLPEENYPQGQFFFERKPYSYF